MTYLNQFLGAWALAASLAASVSAGDPTSSSGTTTGTTPPVNSDLSSKEGTSKSAGSGGTPSDQPSNSGNVTTSGGVVLLNPVPPGLQVSAEVRKAVDLANAARLAFIKKQEDLRRASVSADQTARELIRVQLRQNREAFIEQQQEIRGDLRKKIAQLKDELKGHGDVLDQAKQEAKIQAHGRKGD